MTPQSTLPEPPGEPIGWRYRMRDDSWYVETTAGWWWYDPIAHSWRRYPQGLPM